MRLSQCVVVSAPPRTVWNYLADLDNYMNFISGFTRWDAEGEATTGLGARRRMLIKVGSAEVGGLVEMVEWDEPNDMAWSSVTGIDQRGRFRLRPAGSSSTKVEFRYQYGVAGGGITGWLSEQVSAPSLSKHLRLSLQELKRLVESDKLRAATAERSSEPAEA